MDQMPPDTEPIRGLSRDRLVEAALGLVQEEGLEGLSMRGLADRLNVKAASLYWHVRDRGELMELLAEAILDSVPRPRTGGSWRASVAAICSALGRRVAAQRDAPRILLEAPGSLAESETFRDVRTQLIAAGLSTPEATEVTLLAMTYVIAARVPAEPTARVRDAQPAELAVDSGSRGVIVRAGSGEMQTLSRVPHDRSNAAPAVVRGEKVVVRRLRGVGLGEIELNPGRPWLIHVQAPTWNTVLDIGGLDLRGLHVDSGAAKLEVFLPVPRGVVPIRISSGVVGVALHRPSGTALVANLSTGAVRVKLDDFSTRATVVDTQWETENAPATPDRFELHVSSGAVKVELDSYTPKPSTAGAPPVDAAPDASATALDILLDGVEARSSSRSRA